ncbi:hypothetical protein DLP05_040 [Stenotrophomonas phage vB_SmaS_DLP_5]|uniref:Uncharacterized protein n=1 Tax=Stenotrophomonas phage vB_SmaS_DLP_5 TaxID=2044561 RepID=A0A2D2W2P8_9CAUD|nr:hypothetical protein FDJ07_gp039 [Stenotrophomonas phage vB_SmaS_DLP_5]ATS92398.1 hypothetical protein DLP05_040 [Stenotrophomonas phage vB_SmaS_DLP_5]
MNTKTAYANINEFLSESPEGSLFETTALGHSVARLYHAPGMVAAFAGGKTPEEALKNLSIELARIESEA